MSVTSSRAPTLSVACVASAPGPRVARLLGQVRDIADEIVVAVGAGLEHAHSAWADVTVSVEHTEPAERVWPWLLAQCSGDWILWLDGREIMSSAFVARLPQLLHERDVLQHHVPHHSVRRSGGRWVAGPSGCADEPRLVRNDPATLWAPGVAGVVVEPLFPSRHVERGFYRMEERPIAEHDRPARHGSAPRIPFGDRRLLAGATRKRARIRDRRSASEPLVVSSAELDRCWPGRTLADDAYAASLEWCGGPQILTVGMPRPVDIRVTNQGREHWPGVMRQPLIQLAYRWLSSDGDPLVPESDRAQLPAAVAPGGSAIVVANLLPPSDAGAYVLELDLVHEFVRWFGCTTRIDVVVEPAPAK
jgi:hypothetical protein